MNIDDLKLAHENKTLKSYSFDEILTQITQGDWSLPHFADPNSGCTCQYILSEGYMGSIADVRYNSDPTKGCQETGDDPIIEEAISNAQLIYRLVKFAKAGGFKSVKNVLDKAASLGENVEELEEKLKLLEINTDLPNE